MVKRTTKRMRVAWAKPRRQPRDKYDWRESENELDAILYDAKKLIDKCQFLVRRSEFLHQQGLSFNVSAQELVAEAKRSGTDISDLNERIARLNQKVTRQRIRQWKAKGRKRR